MMPPVLKLLAHSKQATEVYRYHIDWGAPA
jgi:hypothetical protein